MVRCKDCKYYYRDGEMEVSSKFIDGEDTHTPVYFDYVSYWSPIKMCQHSVCFIIKTETDPVDGLEIKTERINGQGILNKNNDCMYFKPKWWKKWRYI